MLQNAVNSIRLGVEDFKTAAEDEARALSSIRNLTAGLLLLFKVKLQALSPPGSKEVLLRERVTPIVGPDGETLWVGSGTKTVDVASIISRLKGLGVDDVEWSLLETLRRRNGASEPDADGCARGRNRRVASSVLGRSGQSLRRWRRGRF